MKHQTLVLLGLLAGVGLLGGCPQQGRVHAEKAGVSEGEDRPVVPPTTASAWAQLYSRDSRTFAARLRTAGVPEATARLLVEDELRQQYLSRQRELIGSADPEVFWQSANAAADRDKQAALRRLAAEQDDLLRELFGPRAEDEAELERLRRLHGPLPEAKLRRVDRICADYDAMADDIRLRTGGVLLATERELLVLLEQEKAKDIAAVLTSEERELHEMQTSPIARRLRARLAAFAPSENEFRALYAAECSFEAQCAKADQMAEAARPMLVAEAEKTLETAIRRALGEKRYADYAAQQTPEYRVAARIAERFGVPTARAGKVVALLGEARARLRTLREDRALAPETARRSVVALGVEVRGRLAALLTEDGAALFERTSCGVWLRALQDVADRAAETEHAGLSDTSSGSASGATSVLAPQEPPR